MKIWINFSLITVWGFASVILMMNENFDYVNIIGCISLIACYLVAHNLDKKNKLPKIEDNSSNFN